MDVTANHLFDADNGGRLEHIPFTIKTGKIRCVSNYDGR